MAPKFMVHFVFGNISRIWYMAPQFMVHFVFGNISRIWYMAPKFMVHFVFEVLGARRYFRALRLAIVGRESKGLGSAVATQRFKSSSFFGSIL